MESSTGKTLGFTARHMSQSSVSKVFQRSCNGRVLPFPKMTPANEVSTTVEILDEQQSWISSATGKFPSGSQLVTVWTLEAALAGVRGCSRDRVTIR